MGDIDAMADAIRAGGDGEHRYLLEEPLCGIGASWPRPMVQAQTRDVLPPLRRGHENRAHPITTGLLARPTITDPQRGGMLIM